MSLNSDGGLRPGATLRVQVYATPGARWADVALGGSGVKVALRERAPGEYVGSHVIRRSERIDPTQLMTVRAGWHHDPDPVSVAFYYPPSFQALAMGSAPATATVTSFTMTPQGRLLPGKVVHFRVEGTPGAKATVSIPRVDRSVPLRESSPGVYTASYTVRLHDDTRAFDDVRVELRYGSQRVVAELGTHGRDYGYGYGR